MYAQTALCQLPHSSWSSWGELHANGFIETYLLAVCIELTTA